MVEGVGGTMNNQSDRGGNPKRERRWQTSQERARVAAELIEEAESLTETAAIASPNDVARDELPPPLRVAHGIATPASSVITSKLDDGENAEPPPPPPAPPAPAEAVGPPAEDPQYISAREA